MKIKDVIFKWHIKRLSQLAILLGILTVFGSSVIGYYSYTSSKNTLYNNVFDSNLNLSRSFSEYANILGTSPTESETRKELIKLWNATKKRYKGSYLCIVDATGKLLLHTSRPDLISMDVGGNTLKSELPGHPKNLRELAASGQDWVGRYISPSGQKQVAAFSYSSGMNALVAVHIPQEAINAEVFSSILPWAAGFIVIICLLLPMSLGLLHRAYSRSQQSARLAQSELKETTDRLSAITGTTMDAITLIDSKGIISYWNPSAERIFGYTGEEVLGREITCIIPPRYRDKHWEGLRKFIKTGDGPMIGKTIEISGLRKDGTELPVELSLSAIHLKGTWHAAGTIRDISDRKLLEAQLMHSQKLEAVGELAGGIAHDFNNILTAIIGYGSILKMKLGGDSSVNMYIDQILTSADRASHLTQGLLAFSRKQEIIPKTVDLNQIIKTTENFLTRLIYEDVELETILSEKDLPVFADIFQLEQVLMNLVTNASDAMTKGGGRLTIKTESTEMGDDYKQAYGYGKHGQYALLSVSDTGTGMDKKTKEKLFEPFFTTKEVGKGTGLGLAMVYGIIKQHRGFINVYSEPERGTTFKIYLPLTASMAETPQPVKPFLSEGGTETILVAEDAKEVMEITSEILREAGYTVITAEDGADAVEKFKKDKDRIELLIFDVIMPKKNGKQAFDEIKKIRPDIKTIFLSGYPSEILNKKILIDEEFDYVLKPINPGDLIHKVRDVLNKKPASP